MEHGEPRAHGRVRLETRLAERKPLLSKMAQPTLQKK
jgi:hypothetical protein